MGLLPQANPTASGGIKLQLFALYSNAIEVANGYATNNFWFTCDVYGR